MSRVDLAPVEAAFVLGHFPELFLIHTGFCFDSGPSCLEDFLRRNHKQSSKLFNRDRNTPEVHRTCFVVNC